MNINNNLALSPLKNFNYSFEHYMKLQNAKKATFMDGNGLPNYAYKPDFELRKKLDSTPGLFSAAKNISATYTNRELQRENLQSLAVSPTQFPEIYQIGCDCAKKLGIAIPNIYIRNEETVNAFTFACDDVEPFIVLSSLIVKRMSLGELKYIIGHECGHIQNYHSTYTTLYNVIYAGAIYGGNIVTNGLVAPFVDILTSGVKLLLNTWSRAAEVTADRAGMICSDSFDDCKTAKTKLLYGAVDLEGKVTTEIDIKSLEEQMELNMNNPTKLLEFNLDHPITIKRIMTDIEFEQCETLYQWRPDLKKPGIKLKTKEEVDARCKKYVDVLGRKGAKK